VGYKTGPWAAHGIPPLQQNHTGQKVPVENQMLQVSLARREVLAAFG
jgi:hypothetical protein